MSVEKFRELGREGYAAWRAEEVAKRKIRKPGEVVYVDREVIREVEKVVEIFSEPEQIEIPRFLAPDPMEMFIEGERQGDETDAETLARVKLEFEILFSKGREGPLSETDEERFRYLSRNIGRG